MNRHRLLKLFLVCFVGAVPSQVLRAAELPPLPSIQTQVKDMERKSTAEKKPSPFSKQELAIMKQSAKELAKAMPSPGLKPGQPAPDFELANAFGQKVRLSEQLKKGPVILSFYRGAWCPFCTIQLNALHQSMPHFKKYDAQLILVTPQKPDHSLAQIEKAKYQFEILSDLDSEVMKQYKLFFKVSPALIKVYLKHGLDIESFNGKDRAVLPVPGTFVIDQKGIIRAAFGDSDYQKRMEPAAIVAALKKLN